MFGSRNRSQSKRDREALIASMPVDEDGCVPEKYLLERNGLRSKRALMADGRSTAKTVYPRRMPPEQAASWVMNPGRYDVEGIDTRSPANVQRKGTRPAKPKTPTRKPAGPKAKTSSSPVPERDPGVVLSGQEIMDTVKLITSVVGNNVIHLGDHGLASNGDDLALSLSRRDGKGLFGLDDDLAERYAIISPAPIKKLSLKAVYKISIEDGELLFRKGPEFSHVDLSVPLITLEKPIPRDDVERLFSMSTVGFDLDADEMYSAADRMMQVKSEYCTLTSAQWGARLTADIKPSMRVSSTEIINRKVGGPTEENVRSVYSVKAVYNATKGTRQYLTKARYGQDRPLVMEGTFGEYHLMVFVMDLVAR